MSRTSEPTSFPHWVALGSLALVLWLFFANTVPAVQERAELRAHAAELTRLRKEYDAAILEVRLGGGQNASYDLQALLVAIDGLGFTPAELCAAYPETDKTGADRTGIADDPSAEAPSAPSEPR